MKRTFNNQWFVGKTMQFFIALFLVAMSQVSLRAQCTPQSGTISGLIFNDSNNNGAKDGAEDVLSDVMVRIYNAEGRQVNSTLSDENGAFAFSSLVDGEKYKVVFLDPESRSEGKKGSDSHSLVQFVSSPSCQASIGLNNNLGYSCSEDSQLALTCFVNGPVTENSESPTIVGNKYAFSEGSQVNMYANHGQTGSIWGMTYKNQTSEIFSSAFVKQYAGLKAGPYAIFTTDAQQVKGTQLYADLASLGINVSGLSNTDIDDCDYGNQVGRVGLGGLDISDDEKTLYTVVLDNNTLVALPTEGATSDNVKSFAIPAPTSMNSGEEFRAFAVKYYKEHIYIGVTVTASVSKDSKKSKGIVYRFNPANQDFVQVFETTYLKGYWQDEVTNTYTTSHWLTDIDFSDDGNMIISLTDRLGHRYCKESSRRVDQQHPDILMAAYDSVTRMYILESNGSVGGLTGSGVSNGQGPDGGEFFGADYFPGSPLYHSEVALGSVFVLPGTNSVVAAVYDPLQNTYSGGLHRYSTKDGSLLGAKELYTDNYNVAFGKATGFGDVTLLCGASPVEIGDFVWLDSNDNGVQDAGEQVLEGIKVNLYDASCTLIASTTTDEKGNYSFDSNTDGLLSGLTYYIEFAPDHYNATTGLYMINNSGYSLATVGSGSDTDDSNAVITGCNGAPMVKVVPTGNDYSFDQGFVLSNDFDLALRKVLKSDKYVRLGQDVTFGIQVINQGVVAAKNIRVYDYIPRGYTFDATKNPHWEQVNGMLTCVLDETLVPGGLTEVEVVLTVTSADPSDYINIAEIGGATDVDGNVLDDIDSTPDDNPNNDMGGEVNTDTDDEIMDDGTVDEDDQDAATVAIFDLALKIELKEDRIYYNGENVPCVITVYNQGTVDAARYTIGDYVPESLGFNPSLNNGWVYSDGRVEYQDNTGLKAGESRQYDIVFNVSRFNKIGEIVDFAEIFKSTPVDSNIIYDFDSTPDADMENDKGGEPEGSTDNIVNGATTLDEDDHDPVMIRTQYFDLALIKTIDQERVKVGDQVTYSITVYNQGTAPVRNISIIDYVPAGITISDDSWNEYGNNRVTKELVFDNLFYPGQSHTETLTAIVNEDANSGMIKNVAEIMSFGTKIEVPMIDIDSKPDDQLGNDIGGVIYSDTDNSINLSAAMDEDDSDPAAIMVETQEVKTECLHNATNYADGQFVDTLIIKSISGLEWAVDQVEGYYDEMSADPPADPTDIMVGTLMTETELTDGMSEYRLIVRRVDNKPSYIRFRSNRDDLSQFQNGGQMYRDIIVNGEYSICDGGTLSYTIENPVDGVTYTWVLPSGVTMATNNAEMTEVELEFPSGQATHEITVEASEGCIAPLKFNVVVGTSSVSLSCKGNVNISLNSNCESLITPSVISTHGSTDGLAVMLFDQKGQLIPGALLTAEHLGQTIETKLIDVCSGNACWGNIKVEDKIAPEILCEDMIELECNKLDEYEGPFATDNCGGIEMVILTSNTPQTYFCDDSYTASIKRRYVAVDAYGNESEPCEMTINLKRPDFDAIVRPDTFTMNMDNAITCGSFDTDENGHPSVKVTGAPMYNGDTIYTQIENSFCNLSAGYMDHADTLSGVVKITRTWVIAESHCDGGMMTFQQGIDIVDQTAPVITRCPEDFDVSTVAPNCEARFTLPLPEAYDECDNGVFIDISYDLGLILDGEDRSIELPYRDTPYTFVYMVRDAANNINTSCSINVTVKDDVPPIAVCKQNITIGIGNGGEGYLKSEDVNLSSFDYCALDRIAIRRMNSTSCQANATKFQDRLKFCCDDVNQTIMVVLGVWDKAGNMNTCMVEVTVQDKVAPVVTAPADVTIDCTDDYYPLSQFGDAQATDDCNATLSSREEFNISTMCKTGYILRIFEARDANNVSLDTQVIHIENLHPFDPNTIVWPSNVEMEGVCDLSQLQPEDLPVGSQRPSWTSDACDLVASTFEDKVYDFVYGDNENCYKVERIWKVIEWCEYDKDPQNYVARKHTQIIKVLNSVKPTIQFNDLGNLETADCNNLMVNFSATGSDDCTPDEGLKYSISVDIDGDNLQDGNYDYTFDGRGNTININRDMPLGDHAVVYTFEDACGNQETKIDYFSVATTKGATIACIDISVGLTAMDLDGDGEVDSEMAMLCVDSLIQPSSTFHPCGTPYELSFRSDEVVKKDTVDCMQLGIITRTIYAIDAFGNVTSCVSTIEVQDNNDEDVCIRLDECVVCPDNFNGNANSNCQGVISGNDFDAQLISNDCGTLTIVHNYTQAPSNTTLDGASFPLGNTDVVWTITDANGRNLECPQVITITDNTNPVITCAADATVTEAQDGTTDCAFAVNGTVYDATATDNCTNVTVTHNYGDASVDKTTLSGITFPVGEYTIVWTAVDGSGNSVSCTMILNITDTAAPGITCASGGTFGVSTDGNEDCLFTASAGILDATAVEDCGTLQSLKHNYTDASENTTLNGTSFGEGTYTITWTAVDNAGNESECDVTFTVVDDIAPILNCKDDMTFGVSEDGTENCTYTVADDSLDPTVVESCDDFTLTHDVDDAPNSNTLAGVSFGVGDHTITWTVDDGVNAAITCTTTITVTDDVAPECPDDNDITIVIPSSGVYTVTESDLPALPTDDCASQVTIDFTPTDITCDSVGVVVVIDYTVSDGSNTTTCSLNVSVEENLVAECNPIDITVNLNEDGEVIITPEMVNNSGVSSCGTPPNVVLSDNSFACNDLGENTITITVTNGTAQSVCTATVTVVDTLYGPEIVSCPENVSITCNEYHTVYSGNIDTLLANTPQDYMVTDNCPEMPDNPYQQTTEIVNGLNDCGYGSVFRQFIVFDPMTNMGDTCTQIITVSAPDPLLDQAYVSSLSLPSEVNIESCDDISVIAPSAMNGNITIDSFEQYLPCASIGINFVDEPMGVMCGDTMMRTWTVTDSCQFSSSDATAGYFTFVQSFILNDTAAPVISGLADTLVVADACTIDMDWSSLISVTDCSSFTSSNNGEGAINPDTFDPSGSYGFGIHEIVVTATDNCGNTATDTFNLTVMASEALLLCEKIEDERGFLGSDTMLVVSALDFIVKDQCFENNDYAFSFSNTDMEDDTIVYTCNELGERALLVFKYFNGVIIDSCKTLVLVQDPLNLCSDNISGTVTDYEGFGVADYDVTLYGSETYKTQTSDQGYFNFAAERSDASSYLLAEKEDEIGLGINVVDMIKIQKHLLGKAKFDNVYQVLAADVNGDRKLSPRDLLELRRIILKMPTTDNLPKWNSVPASTTFENMYRPWNELGDNTINVSSSTDYDFVAIKRGDVDNSYRKSLESRSSLAVVARHSDYGKVDIVATQDMQVMGMDIELNISEGNIIGVASDKLVITKDDYVLNAHDNIHIVLADDEMTHVSEGDVLMTLTVENGDYGWLSLDKDSYLATTSSYEGMIGLRLTNDDEGLFNIGQNVPNPWSETTSLQVFVPSDGVAQLNIYDVSGRIVANRSYTVRKGLNMLTIDSELCKESGVFIYEIAFEDHTLRKKMIRLK